MLLKMLKVKYRIVKNNKILYNDVTNCNIKMKIFQYVKKKNHQNWGQNNEKENKPDKYSGETGYV